MATELFYSANPRAVAISTSGSPSQVSMTITIANQTTGSINLASVTFTLPQDTGDDDLLAPNTTFSVGSVQSPSGTSWSAGATGNLVTLISPSPQGFEPLGPDELLIFTLSLLQIAATGAGHATTIQVAESLYSSPATQGGITIDKFDPGFQIEAFYASVYNVAAGAPVTIRWKVSQALSCEVTAQILDVTGTPGTPIALKPMLAGPCGIGTANPTCNGTIASGTDFDDSRTCTVIGATLFTLTAQGAGNDVSLTSQFIVTVNRAAINFSVYPPVIGIAQTVSINWVAANAGKLLLYIVPQTGSPPPTKDLTGTPIGSMTDAPQLQTTYTLCAFTSASDPQPTREQPQSVAVEPPLWVRNVTVSNLPSPAYPGDRITLDWEVDYVASCDLTCDVASFTQLELPTTGPRDVTLPDPGVPLQTANFQMIPVRYGALGDFTPQPFAIPIQNAPNFSTPLTATPDSGGPKAAVELSWAVDHTDGNGTLSSDFSGSSPQPVDPTKRNQGIQLPDCPIPTPINYTLAVSRQNGKYPAMRTTRVQLTGDITTQWCCSDGVGSGNANYLSGLYNSHPNQRITQIGLGANQGVVYGIYIWYTQNATPDYPILRGGGGPIQETLALQSGEYISNLSCGFDDFHADDEGTLANLVAITLQTSQGRQLTIGSGGYVRQASVPSGHQTIALAWNFVPDRFWGALGLVTCPTSYGG